MRRNRRRTRRQPRTEDTRQAIIQSALALYRADGVEDTRVSAIIKHSGVGRATFYRHFNDADDVLNQAVLHDFNTLMADFEAQRYEHADLAEQIVEDVIWFVRQLRARPVLRLLCSDNSPELYKRMGIALAACREAAAVWARPTFERAERSGRLREGVTLEGYVEWCMFVTASLQTVNFSVPASDLQLRQMLTDFLVPSLIVTDRERAAALSVRPASRRSPPA